MFSRVALSFTILAIAFSLAACTGTPQVSQPADKPAPGADNPAAGMRLAPGLYDQADGTVLAIGTLEYVEVEGGFWAVKDGTATGQEAGGNVVVIANGDEMERTLKGLAGKSVEVRGTRLDGASIRNAGPEMQATEVTEISDTPGPAE